MSNRKEEVRTLLRLTPEEVIKKAGNKLIVCDNLDKLHRRFAEDIVTEIIGNNTKNLSTCMLANRLD